MSDRRLSLVSTVLLVAGVGAFCATRAGHADALHLMPPDSPNVARLWIDERLREQLPMAKPGCTAEPAPIIELRADGVSIDGAERASAEDLRAALVSKRRLWEQINPDRKFPGLVLLAAGRGVRASAVAPWLLAAEQAGYSRIGALLRVPRVTWQTRTLGPLDINGICEEVWNVDASLKRAVIYFGTWGDVVAAGGVGPPDPYARHSDSSRCGSLAAPTSPSLASLFGKARLLRKHDDLVALMNQAKNGVPERIALRVNGTGGVSCECPPFAIPMSDPGEPIPSLLAVPKNGVANFGLRRTLLHFIVVGYFSGAWIDTYEYLHTQGEDAPLTDDETRSSYLENAAEFCLEASCYWTPEVHVVNDEHVDAEERKYIEEDVTYWRKRRTEDIADMPKVGIPKCRREWLTKALLAGE